MKHDEHADEEAVAVVRVMADFAMCLALILLMLVGTRRANPTDEPRPGQAKATSPQPGRKSFLEQIVIDENARFTVKASRSTPAPPMDGKLLGEKIRSRGATNGASILVWFATNALASSLHQGLRDLQAGLGDGITIETAPLN